ARTRHCRATTSARGVGALTTACPRGCRPGPPVCGLPAPVFPPPCVLRGRGRIFPAPARGNPRTPSLIHRGVYPRDVPQPPPTANDRHRQPPANMKLARALNWRAAHENTLVMRRSLDDDEHQGDEVPTVVHDPRP